MVWSVEQSFTTIISISIPQPSCTALILSKIKSIVLDSLYAGIMTLRIFLPCILFVMLKFNAAFTFQTQNTHQMLSDQYKDLQATALQYAEKYQTNNPFPNIYLDNFFEPTFLEQILLEFPDVEKLTDKLAYTNPNEKKLATKGENKFGPKTKDLVHFLNSEPFLNFLQIITGIKETLIPDPYFEGGGFHEIKPGGFLKLHVDFHRHRKMVLDRRLNLFDLS